ncbi:hypothetical protein JG687_00019360 [Phytophthora cactorum]|uniref:Uncharacterized protein n=1 Tax=Phytophthora cactorum TaxID=29920 RepID=A0A329RP68_9STRA|nr:hypothetical protein Pcac1_g8607 [Phytophthora cactorum]KAG2813210.1 hypothetical protein PC112_g14830 [Phytophthora cactorum]KAG2849263.1 hypothetical protein PC111_g1 [Phytophthora cactorum]KAG2869362.1 hypothetical protein PC113_g252 [Phytophthora cactorum]KAG2906866.1 hypothetical protein PC115_g14131 [Phytophthora cactorum]
MAIAYKLMGDRKPQPFRLLSDDAAKDAWRVDARHLVKMVNGGGSSASSKLQEQQE